MKKVVLYTVAIIVAFLITTLFIPASCTKNKSKNEYDVVMSDIDNNKLVTDVAMLGAHDAFSGDIGYLSDANSNQNDIVVSGVVNRFAKGIVVRFSKAQEGNSFDMLYSGVRYFDARITLIEKEFYTCHGYISNTFDYYLIPIIDFLETHPSEFIILDIQDYFASEVSGTDVSEEDWIKLVDHLKEIKNTNNKSIIDFVRYDSKVDSLNTLTVGKVTANKTGGGVVILAKTDKFSEFYYRDGNANYQDDRVYQSIRSYWHENNSTSAMIDGINGEYEYCKNLGYSGIFVVNQAQKTAFIMNQKIIRSLFGWSLTKMAAKFNKELVSDKERFEKWLSQMPILMVDFATSTKGDFNTLANEYIKEYNSK